MDNKQLGIAVAIITIALTIPPVLLGILEYAQNKEKRERKGVDSVIYSGVKGPDKQRRLITLASL